MAILITAITTYIVAILLQMLHDTEGKKKAHAKLLTMIWCDVFVQVGLLLMVMYFGKEHYLYCMGCSYYTLMALSYAIDVYRGKQRAEKNFFKVALFLCFPLQLLQGPISRYSDWESFYKKPQWNREYVAKGVLRIAFGAVKKWVLADRVALALTILLANPEKYQGGYVFLVMLFYALRIYGDFTGGIDMVLGAAECIGLKLPENFNLPYFSKSVKEFWTRWHITMGDWFKDYVFYPLGVCAPMRKFSKWARTHLGAEIGKKVPVYLSTLIVWSLTGLWHGLGLSFLVWGLMNAIIIILSQEATPLVRKFHARFHLAETKVYQVFMVLRTFLIMSALRLFDCYGMGTFKAFASMFGGSWKIKWQILGLGIGDYVILGLGVILLILLGLAKRKGSIREYLCERPWLHAGSISVLVIVLIVFGIYGKGYDATAFIYMR